MAYCIAPSTWDEYCGFVILYFMFIIVQVTLDNRGVEIFLVK